MHQIFYLLAVVYLICSSAFDCLAIAPGNNAQVYSSVKSIQQFKDLSDPLVATEFESSLLLTSRYSGGVEEVPEKESVTQHLQIGTNQIDTRLSRHLLDFINGTVSLHSGLVHANADENTLFVGNENELDRISHELETIHHSTLDEKYLVETRFARLSRQLAEETIVPTRYRNEHSNSSPILEEWNQVMQDLERKRRVERNNWVRNTIGSSRDRVETVPEFVYHDNEDLEYLLQKWGSMFPNVDLRMAGKSQKGIPMWYLIIRSRQVQSNILRPAIKYVGNIHGDEVVGRELLIHFAYHILSNYCCESCGDTCLTEEQRQISRLLDTADLIIMPCANPDGYTESRRENSNRKDLNRNFPDPFTDPSDTLEGREIETRNLMQFTRAYPFALSASFHGGALVASYPFDGKSDRGNIPGPSVTPDDRLFRELAFTYSRNHKTMSRSSQFQNGIVQGSMWYPLYGGMQDFNYVWHNIPEVTIEVSQVKQPAEETLRSFWDANKDAMLSFAERIHQGVYGIVLSAHNFHPLKASITIMNNQKAIVTHPNGDFYRLLPTGAYNLVVSADGYITKTIPIVVNQDQKTTVEILLVPEHAIRNAGFGSSGLIALILSSIFIFLACSLTAVVVIYLWRMRRSSNGFQLLRQDLKY